MFKPKVREWLYLLGFFLALVLGGLVLFDIVTPAAVSGALVVVGTVFYALLNLLAYRNVNK